MSIKAFFKSSLRDSPLLMDLASKIWFSFKLSYQSIIFYFLYPRVNIYKNKINDDLRGGAYKSQFFQDKIIDELLESKKFGFFVDIGANRPIKNSNTFFFEKSLGWTGLAIDPIAKFESSWKSQRKNSKFLKYAIGNSNKKVKFVLFHTREEDWEDMLSGVIGKVRQEDLRMSHEILTVQMRKLKDILDEFEIKKIDLMSIDVEGSEMQVLKGADFIKYRPSIVLIENTRNIYGCPHIRSFMKKNKYKFYARISATDDLYVSNPN